MCRRRQLADLGFLDRFVWHGASAWSADARRDGQPEKWRPGPAHKCRPPTQIEGATARPDCRPWVSGHTDACTHSGEQGQCDRYSIIVDGLRLHDLFGGVGGGTSGAFKELRPAWKCGCGSGVGYDARKWRGRSTRPISDHPETAAGVCRLLRTVCKNVGER